jgi:hypothetical protein
LCVEIPPEKESVFYAKQHMPRPVSAMWASSARAQEVLHPRPQSAPTLLEPDGKASTRNVDFSKMILCALRAQSLEIDGARQIMSVLGA